MKDRTMRYLLMIFFAGIFSGAMQAQDDGLLTIDRLYKKYEFMGEYFGKITWMPDGSAYTRLEKSGEYPRAYDLMKYELKSGDKSVYIEAKKLIPEGEEEPLVVEDYSWSPDEKWLLIFTNTKRVWRYNTKGDYWILNLEDHTLKQLGKNRPESSLMFTKFAPGGNRVAYVSKHDIFVENINTGKVTRLTNDGSDDIINGTFDWVYEEEFACRDGFRWSPDGENIAYWKLDATGVKDFLMINNTDSLYPFVIPVEYPKAGETLSAAKVGVIPAEGGKTVWMDLEGDPRNNYIPRMDWAANSQEIIIQYMNRLQNTNHLVLGNAETGEINEILTEKDDAWLDPVDDLKWMPDGEHFTWVSERTGWKHIYLVSRDGKKMEAVTKGEYDVINIEKINEDKGFVYFIASPEDATQRYLFKTELEGSTDAKRISPDDQPGTHSYNISPDGEYAIHSYSTIEIPKITDIVKLPSHKRMKLLIDNEELKAKYDQLKKNPVEFFTVTIDKDIDIDGYMIKPYNFDASKKYPVLFYVYGEPAGQTVLDSWGGVRYLWHLMIAQKGYIVISMDTRGTPAPKGREWRKACYEKMGVLNSYEQAEAAKKVFEKYDFIDTSRVAIWGWSGGGSSTLNAMFRYPGIYKTGMAVAPVADIHLYDAIYQERYMGTPQLNPEEFVESSPITYAENLEGDLLIVHGTGDDNVHYQGTERLINELIKHNKQFDMLAYPNRSHGIYEGKNTTRHLRTLLTNYLLEHVEPGPKDK